MIVGGYTLHLYCDHPRHPTEKQTAAQPFAFEVWERYRKLWPGEYSDNDRARCVKRAKADGWKLRAGKATCPECAAGRFIT